MPLLILAYRQGQNPNVDVLALKVKGAELKPMKGFPYAGIVGKTLKKAPAVWTDVADQVVGDYQRQCEGEFVKKLRERYPVEIDEKVLSTVNNH